MRRDRRHPLSSSILVTPHQCVRGVTGDGDRHNGETRPSNTLDPDRARTVLHLVTGTGDGRPTVVGEGESAPLVFVEVRNALQGTLGSGARLLVTNSRSGTP